MRIALGSDHAGFRLKQTVAEFLAEWSHEVEDYGCYDTLPVDYPDVAREVGLAVAEGRCDRGILVCSNGVGMSIAANKVQGIRAALCHDTFSARRCREHNDANVLCLGEWVIGQGVARELVWAFLTTGFLADHERHVRRVGKIAALDGERPGPTPTAPGVARAGSVL
ncbi:MAG: ribose 5-phosphate isomerase B [Chloroflexi bacterium]|nr:ribose 5-phosphate isomerase B [Chloroflexota bacterium]